MDLHPDIIAGLNGAIMRKLIFSSFFCIIDHNCARIAV